MKKRFTTIFTITVAAVLISSIAYAAKKKLHSKSEPRTPDISEVDLASELLDSDIGNKHKSPKANDTNKPGDEKPKDLSMVKKPQK